MPDGEYESYLVHLWKLISTSGRQNPLNLERLFDFLRIPADEGNADEPSSSAENGSDQEPLSRPGD